MRMLRLVLACMALPVAFFAVVVLRGVPVRQFWTIYWSSADSGIPSEEEQ